MKSKFLVLVIVLMLIATGCKAGFGDNQVTSTATAVTNQSLDGQGGGEATPTSEGQTSAATPAQEGQLLSFNQIATPGSTLNAASANNQTIATPISPVAAGGENLAGAVEIVGSGGGASAQGLGEEFSVTQATNLETCRTGFIASMSVVSGSIAAQVPYCYVWTIMGEGELNLNMRPGDAVEYAAMMGGNKVAALFILGSGTVTVNGTPVTLSAVPTKFAFSQNDIASMTFNLPANGFAMIEIKDASLAAKPADIRPVDGQPERFRLAEAGFAPQGENNYCAWSLQWQVISTTGNVQFYPTDCWELAFGGTGTVTLTIFGDSTGWETSAQGNTMALWPMGDGQMTVTRNGVQSPVFVPAKGSPGIAMSQNGQVTITISLTTGQSIVMPFGKVQNNIQPQY